MASKWGGRGYKIEDTPYVVLLGDVGTGKSSIVEKVTNEINLASDGDTSVTKSSEVFWSIEGSLLIADTPGSNAMEDKLMHNMWIAGALNYLPVSKMFILVKAETRLDSVVDNIRKYSDRFVTLDPSTIGVMITHMDTVPWSSERYGQPFKGVLSFHHNCESPVPGALLQSTTSWGSTQCSSLSPARRPRTSSETSSVFAERSKTSRSTTPTS